MSADTPEDWQFESWPKRGGGQHVGTITGVRAVHLPTGTEACCQLHRSQHKNRTIAREMVEWALLS